jgi:hypothetical protein
MKAWIEKWQMEKKKNGLFKVVDGQTAWWSVSPRKTFLWMGCFAALSARFLQLLHESFLKYDRHIVQHALWYPVIHRLSRNVLAMRFWITTLIMWIDGKVKSASAPLIRLSLLYARLIGDIPCSTCSSYSANVIDRFNYCTGVMSRMPDSIGILFDSYYVTASNLAAFTPDFPVRSPGFRFKSVPPMLWPLRVNPSDLPAVTKRYMRRTICT